MGATPDGLTECDCCDRKGVLEIKCPFCLKDQSMEEASGDKRFCLEKVNSHFQLKRDHQYYYQVQLQLFLTQREYCDFVVWTQESVHIETLPLDKVFVRNVLDKLRIFYVRCIIPELTSHYFSKKQASSRESEDLFCYCRKHFCESMIECSSDLCIFKKFHLQCIGLKRKPKPQWQCPECKKQRSKNL